ncbi:hypothetical protein L1987_43477 [Smallanthus sonchifolius]|uniref:Uncharacterized protein n=1 Tax=Smallanthus sonchifolius TaxID=185202 RepID=A0ACB9GMI2_9ASTR|nr:hypothetical protein L1987_43477 [Smallanthus sonchifolius]
MWLVRHHSRGPPASEAAPGKGEYERERVCVTHAYSRLKSLFSHCRSSLSARLLLENLKEPRREGVTVVRPLVLSLLVHAPPFSIIAFLSVADKFRVPTFPAL